MTFLDLHGVVLFMKLSSHDHGHWWYFHYIQILFLYPHLNDCLIVNLSCLLWQSWDRDVYSSQSVKALVLLFLYCKFVFTIQVTAKLWTLWRVYYCCIQVKRRRSGYWWHCVRECYLTIITQGLLVLWLTKVGEYLYKSWE